MSRTYILKNAWLYPYQMTILTNNKDTGIFNQMLNRMKANTSHSIYLSGKILIILIAFAGWQCAVPVMIQTSIPTYPSHPLVPEPDRMVIANAYDVSANSFRDNKEKQFIILTGHMMRHAAMQIEKRSNIKVDVVEGPVHPAHPDSVRVLMAKHSATHAILITSFNAFFDQTHVNVTKTENGKDKEAFYDIVVDVGYIMQDLDNNISKTPVSMRKFHSSRNVVSGLLAFGPNIVSNTDDVVDGVHANVDSYLKEYFPGSEPRSRPLFVTQEFRDVGTAIKAGNYEVALNLSQQLTESPNNEIAVRALYNCAVLSEYYSRHLAAKSFLEEALMKQDLIEASNMLSDY
jgi:hypothetical protein